MFDLLMMSETDSIPPLHRGAARGLMTCFGIYLVKFSVEALNVLHELTKHLFSILRNMLYRDNNYCKQIDR